jgi:flagellar basal-body rod modification protein FlgD
MATSALAATNPPSNPATLNQPNGTARTQSSTGALSSFANNFDNFLTLLTAQLRNQDPLSPLNATEFTTQLVQFTGVEQMLQQNKNLQELINLQRSWSATNALGYIGKTIEAAGNGITLSSGSGAAPMRFTADAGAVTGNIAIRDSQGTVVRTMQNVTLRAGEQTVNWDGRDDRGSRAPAGTYTYEVAAKNARGEPVSVTSQLGGVVTGVETRDGQQTLLVGNVRVPIASVTSVRETATTSR